MKIAFVGKGGSGKSTISSLFTKFLLDKDLPVLGFDADININYFQNMNLEAKGNLALSNTDNTYNIKKYLIGNNDKIQSPSHFVKTTPPSKGSSFLKINDENYIIKNYSQKIGSGYFFYVGKYESDGIGTSCYHNNLSIFENILSHTKLEKEQYLVADMSAGTDAFSNSLHAQFNKIILIVNPTQESIKVAKDFINLAKDAKTYDNVYVAINNYEDEEELEHIQDQIGKKAEILLQKNKIIRQKSLFGKYLYIDDTNYKDSFEKIINTESDYKDKCILENLKNLHIKYAQQAYVIRRVGDITLQAKN
ncbi:hypothetical protein [Candidatus Absconditicoccus praedator]|uniref:nucleotide-binding protein n=1 Tax=Candidatus Absconditicoccus praedator TaxID=2735562 RepID=UPI001E2DCCFF|nr:hypothetical protein [Candidatus Absconditicoccus praedator]UFX82919.1 hypothetical protein HLG78_02180 [Candidatus Absconditicoccus praedator]